MTTPPTPAQLRAELERLVVTDLLGPSDPHEQLPGVRSPVREWYLVGMLAPMGTIVDPSRNDGDDLQDGDEGGAPGPDDRPAKVVLFPSSAGFTAAVDGSCAALVGVGVLGSLREDPPTRTRRQRAPTSACGSAIRRAGRWSVPLTEGDLGRLVPDAA